MKLKRIGIALLSLGVLGCLASCGNGGSSSTESQATETGSTEPESPAIYDGNIPQFESIAGTSLKLNSITVNTENVQTLFFVGDTFNSDNISITRRFLRIEDATEKVLANNLLDETTYCFVDSSAVDMNNEGEYFVYVSTRVGANTRRTSYKVQVKSSIFETSPNITYAAGLDVTLPDGQHDEDNERTKTILLNDALDVPALVSSLNVKLHTYSTDANCAITDTVTQKSSSDVVVSYMKTSAIGDGDVAGENTDYTTINNQKTGTYMIKLTLDNGSVSINGVQYENKVSSYIIVKVINPIKTISLNLSAQTQFEASVNGINAEATNWELKVTPTVGSKYTLPFSYDLFDVEGIDIFKWGKQQDVKVVLKEDPSIYCTKAIIINESTTQDIKAYYDLTPTLVGNNGEGKPEDMLLGGTDFIHGPLPKEIKIETGGTPTNPNYASICDTYYTSGATYVGGRSAKSTDKYGSVTFDVRLAIKGQTQAIKIDMAKAGQIVVFYASQADEERTISIYDEKDGKLGDELASGISSSTKQVVSRITFDVAEAGTYYIADTDGGLFIHGFIIATAK